VNPSTSFQRGDRVSATNTLFKMHGTVERIQAFTGLVRVRWDSRPGLFGSTVAAFSEWVHPSHLALLSREVSQATFSKGDVVEIRTQHPSEHYQGALGVVVEVTLDADRRGTQYKVRPYGPSKPFEELSRGPFTYWGHELVARRANGLVPVNFVRQALGLKPAPIPGRLVDPPKWTVVGTTDSGADVLFASPLGTPPPKVADLVDVKPAPRGLQATFQVADEASAWLNALAQPTSIKISEAMRRRGITTEGDIRQIDEANASLTSRNRELERKLAGERDSRHATEAILRETRADLDVSRQQRSFQAYQDQANELHRAHVSRQQAENERDRLRSELANAQRAAVFNSEAAVAEADRLRAEIRDLKNQLGTAVNRSRRRGEAIERVQNAVRGL
jgi:hypothetical protein